MILLCIVHTIRSDAEQEQQVRLEDIEHDNLQNERQKHKEIIVAQQTQHIKAPSILAPHLFQQTYEEGPQDIFVTPPTDVIYAEKGKIYICFKSKLLVLVVLIEMSERQVEGKLVPIFRLHIFSYLIKLFHLCWLRRTLIHFIFCSILKLISCILS